MVRFDELPQEILQRIAYELECYDKTDLCSLALTCRSTLDCARTVIWTDFSWHHWSATAAQSFFAAHPRYFSVIREVMVIHVNPHKDRIFDLFQHASGLRGLVLSHVSETAMQDIGEATLALTGRLRLEKLDISGGQYRNGAFWIGVVQLLTSTALSLRSLILTTGWSRAGAVNTDNFPQLPRVNKLWLYGWQKDVTEAILKACGTGTGGLSWDTVDDDASLRILDTTALQRVTRLNVDGEDLCGDGEFLLSATVGRFARLRAIEGWRLDGSLDLQLLSSSLRVIDIWIGDSDHLRSVIDYIANYKSLQLESVRLRVDRDDPGEGWTRATIKELSRLGRQAERSCAERNCEFVLQWM